MRAAESKAVVQENAAIGNVNGLQVGGESFAKLLDEGQIKSGVRRQVAWWRAAVGESRSVIDVR